MNIFIYGIFGIIALFTFPGIIIGGGIVMLILHIINRPDLFPTRGTRNSDTLKGGDELTDEGCFCDPGKYYKDQLESMFKPDLDNNPELQKLRDKILTETDKKWEESCKIRYMESTR